MQEQTILLGKIAQSDRFHHERLETTIVYVTHDQVEAMTLAQRIVVMDRGLIMQIGTPLEVYDNPKNPFVAGFIGSLAMNFLEARVTEENGSLFVRGDHFKLLMPGQPHERLDRKGFSNIYIMSSKKNKDPRFSREEIVPFAETWHPVYP